MMERHEKLEIWKDGYALALAVYKATKDFPREEIYGLTSQLCRASVSIPANIAEGSGRASRKEFVQFIHLAKGSLAEAETLLKLARDLDYLGEKEYAELKSRAESLSKMLNAFVASLRRSISAFVLSFAFLSLLALSFAYLRRYQ